VATITGTPRDAAGRPLLSGAVSAHTAYLSTNIPERVGITVDGDVRLGIEIPLNVTGNTYTLTGLPDNFPDLQGKVIVRRGHNGDVVYDSTWFDITTGTIDVDSVPKVATPIALETSAELIAEMIAIRDQTVAATGVPGAMALTDADPASTFRRQTDSRYARTGNAQRDVGFGEPQHEDGAIYTYPNRLNFGPVNSPPPVVAAAPSKGVDLIAHWYNDYGLESTASAAGQANGAYLWYDWRWNFPTNTGDGVTTYGYDPQRHPLQGFYQGDNPSILGWQAKWMAEAGVTAVSLVVSQGINYSTWQNPSDKNHWMWQLLENTPAAKALRWVMWLRTGSNADFLATRNPGDGTHPTEQQWAALVQQYATRAGGYVYTEDGRSYPVVFCWDGELVRGAWDNYSGATKTTAAFVWLSEQFKALGYDGVMVVCRNASSTGVLDRNTLRNADVLYVDGQYAATNGTFTTFADYAEAAAYPTTLDAVPAVLTSYESTYPHPSNQNLPGTSPELFALALRRAVDSVIRNGQRRIVFINNVSEWAESGPGLIPTVADGFGYLDAIRSLPPVGEARQSTTDGLVQRVTTGDVSSLTLAVPSWARRVELRFAGSSTLAQELRMRINGDAGNNYDTQRLYVTGSAAPTAVEVLAGASAAVGQTGDTAAKRSLTVVTLHSGPGSGSHRAWLADCSRVASSGQVTWFKGAGSWRSGATITSLTLMVPSGTVRAGSVVELYCWR
jgi:hypothetical protein